LPSLRFPGFGRRSIVVASQPFGQWRKVGGAAGIASVVLGLVPAALIADEPRFADSGREITVWYAHNGNRWLASTLVFCIALAFLFLPFLSALTSVLASAEGEPPMWSRVAAAGGVLYVAVWLPGLGGEGIVSYLTTDTSADVARAGMAFALFVYSLAGLFAAVFVLSASLVVLQKGVFWSWLGWYGFVAAAVNLAGAAAIFDSPDGPFGVIRTRVAPPALALWVVAVSIGMLRSQVELAGVRDTVTVRGFGAGPRTAGEGGRR
jgi:hypothetical protein